MLHRALAAAALVSVVGCGGGAAHEPTSVAGEEHRTAATPLEPAADSPAPPVSRHEPPATPAADFRGGMRTLRQAAMACARHGDRLGERFARCACEAACNQRFHVAAQEGDGALEVTLPFRDVDGLRFAIEAGGTVAWCRYTDGAALDVSVSCADRAATEAATIPGTSIEDTAGNRRVIDFCERYRAALEAADAEALLALASERYLDDGGTPWPGDDVTYDDLQSFMPRWTATVTDVRFEARYHRVLRDGDLVRVELSYEGTFTTTSTSPPSRQRRAEDTTLVLERLGDDFRILSGM